ncbi:MAG TPA: hypothetical protein VIW78_04915 [Burkholderiales bacterium]
MSGARLSPEAREHEASAVRALVRAAMQEERAAAGPTLDGELWQVIERVLVNVFVQLLTR